MKFNRLYLLILTIFLIGCSQTTSLNSSTNNKIEILPPTNSKNESINYIRTTEKKMALTFNGLGETETMFKILDELEKGGVKATFFVQGNRVAEDPDLVHKIIERGHTVHNNTLTHQIMDDLSYEQTFLEIALANKVFQEKLNYSPKYVRSRTGDSTENMELVASQLGMEVIGYTINPQDRNMQSAEEIADYIQSYSTRGAIIQLNTYINPAVISAIPLIIQNAKEDGYELATLDDLMKPSMTYQTADEILHSNQLSFNDNYENTNPILFYTKDTSKREVALTFDDYASDATTTELLAVLEQFDIKCTFFLIGKAVEQNPNLAKLILEAGHEVASHSYNHLDVTQMDVRDLQEDIIKADKVLTEALQEMPLRFFRPPKGIIDEQSAKVIIATGMEVIAMYDVASFDWDKSLSAKDIYQRVKERTRPGSVITMHIQDGTNTIEALHLIIKDLQKQGYEFKKMSEWVLPTED